MKFKTNINCGSCIASVTPVLDEIAGPGNWEVNTNLPLKILSIDKPGLSPEEITLKLSEIGYKADLVAMA
mgnify:CR=1 FL=1